MAIMNVFRKILNADVKSSAAIALSKLQTSVSIPTGWTVNEANLATPLIGNYVDVTVPSAAGVLTLYSAPYSLVPAPASGYMNIFDGARFTLTYGSAAYASIHDATIRYTDGSGQVCGTLTASGFFDATSNQERYIYPTVSGSFTPVAAAALVLYNGTGNMTTGDSPLSVRVFYHVVPV